MACSIKIKPLKDKNKDIEQHQPKYGENGWIAKQKINKLLLLIFTITAAFFSVGMVSFTIYCIVKSHGNSTVDLSVTDLNPNRLQSEGHNLMETFDTTRFVEANFDSKVAIEKTKASERGSSTAINRSTSSLSFSDLDTSRSSSKGYMPETTHKDKSSVENISHSEGILMNKEALEVKSTTRITKSVEQDCYKDCKTTRRPVCGSDNKTYSNECVLEMAACKAQGENLTMAHRGSCRIRIGTTECCSEIRLDSQGVARKLHETNMGRYKFHSIFNERPMYKSVRLDAFVVWQTTINAWVITDLVNSTRAALYSTCTENCLENCLSSHWKAIDGNNWVNDDTVIIECNSNSEHDVDPCKENKPLEINNQKTGVILSPNTQNSSICEWHIKADTSYIVKLTILEFRFENKEISLSVQDGSSMLTPMIGAFGENLPHIEGSLFSTGPDMYIVFRKRYPNSKFGTFKLQYDIVQCDWNDWKIEKCSRTCGGGQQTKKRTLRNADQNATNCGSSTLTEPCNVRSCTDPICNEFEILSSYFQGTFTLQNFTRNAKPVYMSSHGDSLYSSKDAWVISPYVGFNVTKKRSAICYDEETPAGCNVWWFEHEGRYVSDPAAKAICKHFI